MRWAKPFRPIATIIRPPLRKIIRTDLQLLGDLVALSPAINRRTAESLISRLKTRRFAVDILPS
jgi:hypothetical protein